MIDEKNIGDKNKIEDKYFKEIIPGLNRLLNILGIPGEITEILPTEYQNYRNETKRMDLCFDLNSKETLNLEFKSTYITKEDILNSLDYATYLKIKYGKKTNSYFISTKKKKNSEYEVKWHNDNSYKIPVKTFKEFNADERLENLKKLMENNQLDDESEEINDLLLIPFMSSDKSPKELIVECIILANKINIANIDTLNEIKNLLKFLASKYTDTQEEFKEIERMVKMEGGMIENTVKQMQRIYREEGIQIERQNTIKALELEKNKKKKEIEQIQKNNQKEIEQIQNNNQKEIERIKRELKERGIEEELIEEVIK